METIILIIAESIQIGANPYSVLGIYVHANNLIAKWIILLFLKSGNIPIRIYFIDSISVCTNP